jgi:hypothetical protein
MSVCFSVLLPASTSPARMFLAVNLHAFVHTSFCVFLSVSMSVYTCVLTQLYFVCLSHCNDFYLVDPVIALYLSILLVSVSTSEQCFYVYHSYVLQSASVCKTDCLFVTVSFSMSLCRCFCCVYELLSLRVVCL